MFPSIADQLEKEISRSGYYPQVAAETVRTALGRRTPTAFLVHPETTFDGPEVRRHLTVLVLTDAHLLSVHVDDEPPIEGDPHPVVMSYAEIIRLGRVARLALGQVFPTDRRMGAVVPREVSVTISWGGSRRLELAPASCGDPKCQADHGLEGASEAEDVMLRVSAEAEGPEAVQRALDFFTALDDALADLP